jgi:hypothetical protein
LRQPATGLPPNCGPQFKTRPGALSQLRALDSKTKPGSPASEARMRFRLAQGTNAAAVNKTRSATGLSASSPYTLAGYADRPKGECVSLRRLEQRRTARAKLLQQRHLLGLGGCQMAQLNVTEAADFFWDGGKADREVMVVGCELCQQLIE